MLTGLIVIIFIITVPETTTHIKNYRFIPTIFLYSQLLPLFCPRLPFRIPLIILGPRHYQGGLPMK